MVLSAQTIRQLCQPPEFLKMIPMISPFYERTVYAGMTFGLSGSGYDIRLKQPVRLLPEGFILASTVEHFHFPNDVAGVVHDKSSLARQGLSVFNTFIEAGWTGWLTLELSNRGPEIINLPAGSPIAQLVFHRLDHATHLPYRGKYQDQADAPVPAIQEKTSCPTNAAGTTTPSRQYSLFPSYPADGNILSTPEPTQS